MSVCLCPRPLQDTPKPTHPLPPPSHTHAHSVYAPAIIPTLLAFIITTVETVGDVTASAEASRVHQDGQLDSRIQGGVLADGICSIVRPSLSPSLPFALVLSFSMFLTLPLNCLCVSSAI